MYTYLPHTATVLYKHYEPSKDRVKPHLLELFLDIPPLTMATVSVTINRGFLKWIEHPPDAHHGFYIK